MKVLRYLQVNFHLQKKRSIILTILVAIVGIMIGVEPVIVGIYQSQAQPNWWDVIFASLGNKFFVLAIFGGEFSYLISDSVIENAFGCSLLTRINNRTRWWYSKCFLQQQWHLHTLP